MSGMLFGGYGSYAASTVKCCGNSGDITAVEYSGGIAGHISNSNDVSYCYNKGIINTIGNDSRSGGLAGKFALLRDRKSSILSFYNLGDIISKGYSGGLVGDTSLFINSNLLIKNTYSAASNIEGSCAGGIFGGVNDKLFSLINCYYLNAGAVKGIGNSDDDAGIAKSAVNMKKEAFRDSLGDPYLYVNNDYPVLCWELGLLVIELSKTEIELNEFHKTEQLTAYEMKNDVTWQSSDETVAIVDEKGFVTAVGNGNCVISAIVGESKAECYVTVSFDYYLEESGFRLDVDKGKTIIVYSRNTGQPIDASELKFTSSNERVATVNAKGIVSANEPGTAYINIEIGSLTLCCKVVVPTLMCDVNEDGEFTVADLVLVQKWILNTPGVKLNNWKAADLCEDGTINVFDLCYMKKELIKRR